METIRPNLRKIASVTIVLVIIILFLSELLLDLPPQKLYFEFSTIITFIGFYWFFFNRSLWKYKFFNFWGWLYYAPNLNGWYNGRITSYDQNQLYDIRLHIYQTFSVMRVRIDIQDIKNKQITPMRWYSDSADIRVDQSGQEFELYFSWREKWHNTKGDCLDFHVTLVQFGGDIKISRDNNIVLAGYYSFSGEHTKSGRLDLTKIREEEAPNINILHVFENTWRLSENHLLDILDLRLYTSNGKRRNLPKNRISTHLYNEDLFQRPKEILDIDEFLKSNRRLLLITGKSGVGKSFLLVNTFLRLRRENGIVLFLNCRLLDSSNFQDFIKNMKFIDINSGNGFDSLEEILSAQNKEMIIILDALNEFNKEEGSFRLIENIFEMIYFNENFHNIRIICSIRNETWNLFMTHFPDKYKSLFSNSSFSPEKNVINIEGFEDASDRKDLYRKYQGVFNLSPKDFNDLHDDIKQLIGHPFMMQLIAESYKNYTHSESIIEIPKQKTNFYLLFNELLKRRMVSISRQMNSGNVKNVEQCLSVFSEQLLNKLMQDHLSDRNDSLSLDDLKSNPKFTNFIDVPISGSLSIFNLILEAGLIVKESKYDIKRRDVYSDLPDVYKFFHDQFTQFNISRVLGEERELGKIRSMNIHFSENTFENAKIEKVRKLLYSSRNSPILPGALDHWFYDNLKVLSYDTNIDGEDLLEDVFDSLLNNKDFSSSSEPSPWSGIYIDYIGNFFHGLIERRVISPDKMYKKIFESKYFNLKRCITQNYLNSVSNILKSNSDSSQVTYYNQCLRFIIRSMSYKDDNSLIREFADAYAALYHDEASRKNTVKFFKDLFTFEFTKQILSSLIRNKNSKDKVYLSFLVKLATRVFILNSANKDKDSISSLRVELNANFKFLFFQILIWLKWKSIFGNYKIFNNNRAEYGHFLKIGFIERIEEMIAKTGEDHWQQAIGNRHTNRLVNNGYFVDYFMDENGREVKLQREESDGKQLDGVQRNIFRQLYPYLIFLHNAGLDDDFSQLNITNHEFMNVLKRAISFYRNSIVGYVATLMLAVLIKSYKKIGDRQTSLSRIIDEFLAIMDDSNSALSFTIILIDTITKPKPNENITPEELTNFNLVLLNLYKDKIIEKVIDAYSKKEQEISSEISTSDGDNIPNIFSFVDIPTHDNIDHWDKYRKVLDLIVSKLGDNDQNINKFTRKLPFVCHFPNLENGIKVINYFLDKRAKSGRNDIIQGHAWTKSILRLIASMYIREKDVALQAISSYNLKTVFTETKILDEIDDELLKLKGARSSQTNWNETLISAFYENKQLRYYIIRDLFGGLVTTSNVPDMSYEYKNFVINYIKDSIRKDKGPSRSYKFTEEEQLKLCTFNDDNNGSYYNG